VLVEVLLLLFFAANYRSLHKRRSSIRHRLIFSILLLTILNFQWITGGGISRLSTVTFFLSVEFILVILDSSHFKLFFVILLMDFILLFCLEYFFQFNLYAQYEDKEGILVMSYLLLFFLLLFGGYLTAFLKINYNNERSSLNQANRKLQEKTNEISGQNEALKASKEALDLTISKLDSQKKELMVIKETLEDKVEERTTDLVNMNERLLSQNQQLEQYAYITSHNLRSPIAQIKGLVHLLPLKDDFDEQTKEILGRLKGSTASIEKVFDDLSIILNVKNSMQQPWEEVDFVKEIRMVVESLKASSQKKNVKIEVPSIESFNIKSLRPYVYSILHNLIENAIKYSDVEKVNSFVKIELSETSKHQKISVVDNGIGIDMEIASGKVFQMYQRFNNTHPGRGFGLFLVKAQMEAMGGVVELESVHGQGSRFDLYFPKEI
jgi:signal transduction histidine kinase